MSKITRHNGNLIPFAGEALANERTTFGTGNQNNDLSAQITEQFKRGWFVIGTNDLPPKQWFNGIHYTMSQFLAYLFQTGVAEWNSEQEYFEGSVCTHAGEAWMATVDEPTDEPEADSQQWKKLITTDDLSTNADGGTVVVRNQAGTFLVSKATADGHPVRKKEFDELQESVSVLSTSFLYATSTLFVKPVRGKPLLEKTGVISVKIPSGLTAMVDGTLIKLSADITLSLDADLVGSTAVAGTDYFVYLKTDATAYISASDVEPEGRLIAGFHYGLTGHTEAPSGNKTESDMVKLRGINAHTFWDLTFRANKWTNRGLTFDGINWIDIYLADELYAVRGWSKAGGWIAGGGIERGRKFPIIPTMFGGNGSATYGKLTPFVAWDMLNAAGMEPISYKQFAHAMYGVEEGLPAAGIETITGKIEHYPRLTSRFGVEQATGVQYIWGADFGSSSSGSWLDITDGRGQVYSGATVALLGARRDSAAGRPGSRASRWDDGLTDSSWSLGVRGLRDHLNLDVGDDSRQDE